MSEPLPVNKEIAVLSYLTEIHKLLAADPVLSDTIADKMETLPVGKNMRHILMSKRKDWSYYNEYYALQLADILDEMELKKEPREFHLDDYAGISIRTLYLRVYQSWFWLIDKHPLREKYAKMKLSTKIRQASRSVFIEFKGSNEKLIAREVNMELNTLNKLQNRISEFLTMDLTQDTMFDEKKLSLSEEQINQIKDSLAGLPEDRVKVIIEPTRLRILRKVT